MPHEIYLESKNRNYILSYLPLIDKILHQFPEFKQFPYYPERIAEIFADIAKDIGKKYSQAEIEFYGLGISLDAKVLDDWASISFWVNSISIDLPNYPLQGIDNMIVYLLPILDFFDAEGFCVYDPENEKVIEKDNLTKFLTNSYLKRQGLVSKVNEIVNK